MVGEEEEGKVEEGEEGTEGGSRAIHSERKRKHLYPPDGGAAWSQREQGKGTECEYGKKVVSITKPLLLAQTDGNAIKLLHSNNERGLDIEHCSQSLCNSLRNRLEREQSSDSLISQ